MKKFNKIYSAIHWALPNLILIFCISWDLQLKLWWARHTNYPFCDKDNSLAFYKKIALAFTSKIKILLQIDTTHL